MPNNDHFEFQNFPDLRHEYDEYRYSNFKVWPMFWKGGTNGTNGTSVHKHTHSDHQQTAVIDLHELLGSLEAQGHKSVVSAI